MALLRSVATVGGFTMASRVLGFARDILIAGLLGAGPLADAFVVAFRIPNLFRRLVAEGAFTAAFVPLFARTLEADGRPAALSFAQQALSVMLTGLLLITLAAEIAMPWVIHALAPGFAERPEKFELTVEFTRITFPYLLFMALVALLGGMLNALYRFSAMAAAPILLNVVLIGALLVGHFVTGLPAHALVWGVALAGLGQLIWLVIACFRAGLPVALRWPRLTAGIKRLFRLMLPGVIGGGVTQINIVVGTAIASLLGDGPVSFLYYADRVYQLPLGVIGIAVGTALLPLLSRQLRAGEDAAAAASLNRALELSALLTIPATAALLVIPGPIISVLFERGAFSPGDAAATALALAAFSAGLPAYVLIKVLQAPYFAREDTTTPVVISVAAMIVNVALALALMRSLGHVGIALATAIAAWLNSLLLLALLRRREAFAVDRRLVHRFPRVIGASGIMALALWLAADVLHDALAAGEGSRIAALAALVILGLGVYAGAVQLSGAARLSELRGLLRKEPA